MFSSELIQASGLCPPYVFSDAASPYVLWSCKEAFPLLTPFSLNGVGSLSFQPLSGFSCPISDDRISLLGVVRIPHKAVGPVAVPPDW